MPSLLQTLTPPSRLAIRWLEGYFKPVADLLVRLYLANVFFSSGLTKIEDWSKTVALFTDEYRVPVLPPALAAALGTFGELFFPVLLVLGLAGRFGALALFGVNAMAVISYYHVLSEAPALLLHHYLWGLLILTIIANGPGKLSLDAWIARRLAA
ncbi:DoxX family protein [Parachitinimonas caeni]|uniref:DoxX family protein n=1 Tax=Parachitinimonas caeni TaxID=3031301 RepID=A0ABT7E1U5_9NEIS|nr:DoxX family protein [Parachitinimonas caeni]MDK2126283.1 DoxX family protein [Parachitinimonas caeni]